MGVSNRYDGPDKYEINLIKKKAKQLEGYHGFTESDCEDIQQDLVLHVWLRLPNWDSRRASRHTFVARVIENFVKNLIKRQKAAYRDYRKNAYSLDDELKQDNGARISRRGQVSQEYFLEATGRTPSNHELKIDLQRLLDHLTPEQQEICIRLKTSTISELSAAMGKPRSSVYEKIYKLRPHLESAGLKEYL